MEITGTIKTMYISMIQRKWKRIMSDRKKIIQMRKSPNELRMRSIRGKWTKKMT